MPWRNIERKWKSVKITNNPDNIVFSGKIKILYSNYGFLLFSSQHLIKAWKPFHLPRPIS